MLIKEFRIPLPLTLEEYRIAQLYMIQKKSRLESTGSGSAVEIIENEPYENGPGGNGQYTKKIYHIGSHLPNWLKSLLPKTALCVEEEAWNAYPYTKTRHTCPFIGKFFIDIETHYLPDYGQTENIFKLSKNDRKNIEIDLVDPIKDTFPHKDYKKEEDPHIFVSTITNRGPLQDDWLEKYKHAEVIEPIMCAYKLIKVEFKYWGMQTKIEQFILNGLRNPILVGHRQAWAWQDEWYGLTIDDIRALERQTQLELSRRMGQISSDGNDCEFDDEQTAELRDISEDDSTNGVRMTSSETNYIAVVSSHTSSNNSDHEEFDSSYQVSNRRKSRALRRSTSTEQHSISQKQQEKLLEIHMKHIEQSESSADDEYDDDAFYDALETFDGSQSRRTSLLSSSTIAGVIEQKPTQYDKGSHSKTLVIVVQGGNICDLETDTETRQRDFQTFERLFYTVCNSYFPNANSLITFEVISCPSLSIDIMQRLKTLDVSSNEGLHAERNVNENVSNSFPFGSLPLLITQSPSFQSTVDQVMAELNQKYAELVLSLNDEKSSPNVYIMADSVGGLLIHEALACDNNDDLVSLSSDNISFVSVESEMFASDKFMLDFIPCGVFTFGSPIGIVMLNRKLSSGKVPQTLHCGQMYNLFHPFDPMSSRLEPMLDKSFGKIKPALVPRHQAFPYNHDIQYNYTMLCGGDTENYCGYDNTNSVYLEYTREALDTKLSVSSACSSGDTAGRKISTSFGNKSRPKATWWGTKRIDYMLYCPEGLQEFPVSTLLHLCYNSYWESKDLVTFIFWQILDASAIQSLEAPKLDLNLDLIPKEKWLKKRTNLKIKNMKPNHRANDIISLADKEHEIYGKFAYGPVDLAALSGEKVDVYIASYPHLKNWTLLGSDLTDKHGRLIFKPSTRMEPGIYSLQMVVRGDHSHIDCNMALLSPQTDAVVFSIDGSFLASVSLRGIDPKIRGGAVDVVRYWTDLGYMIIYVSSRLIYQKQQVLSWLSQHNFPFGMVQFCENISTDFNKNKIEFLKNLTKHERVIIHAAYGSSRDIPVFISELRLPGDHVFLIGKKSKSKKAHLVNWITDGYSSHLNDLKRLPIAKRSVNNKKMFLTLGVFERYVLNTKKALTKKKISHTISNSSPISRTYSSPIAGTSSDRFGSRGNAEVEKKKSFIKHITSKSK